MSEKKFMSWHMWNGETDKAIAILKVKIIEDEKTKPQKVAHGWESDWCRRSIM